jgi:hypothetical protein
MEPRMMHHNPLMLFFAATGLVPRCGRALGRGKFGNMVDVGKVVLDNDI